MNHTLRKPFAAFLDKLEALVRATGTDGLRPSVAAAAVNRPHDSLSNAFRHLMDAGRVAKMRHSYTHATYYAPEHAPAGAELRTPKPPAPPKPLPDSAATLDTLAMLQRAGSRGITTTDVSHQRSVANATAYATLQRLVQRGRAVNVVYGHRDSRYYLPEHAPAERPQQLRPRQRMTSVRDENTRLPLEGEPIITERTKVTRAAPFVDRRFAFEPPPGWRGQITQDWRERRMREAGR